MSANAGMRGGIIAAGDGQRLRDAGFPMPKPLVPVAGTPLIASVIGNFVAAGIRDLVIIVNEQEQDCVTWVRSHFPDLAIDFIVKTTPSSLASFREVSARLGAGRALISTVDAWCDPEAFVRFVGAAIAHPPTASVLAITPFVDDEKPLWVRVSAGKRIREIGGTHGDAVTAGMYLLSARARARAAVADHPRLRDFLMSLADEGEALYGEVIDTVVDVDRPADVLTAEALALGRGVGR